MKIIIYPDKLFNKKQEAFLVKHGKKIRLGEHLAYTPPDLMGEKDCLFKLERIIINPITNNKILSFKEIEDE